MQLSLVIDGNKNPEKLYLLYKQLLELKGYIDDSDWNSRHNPKIGGCNYLLLSYKEKNTYELQFHCHNCSSTNHKEYNIMDMEIDKILGINLLNNSYEIY